MKFYQSLSVFFFSLLVLNNSYGQTSCTGVLEWSPTDIYNSNNRVVRNGSIYTAKWWTQGNDPVTTSGTTPDKFWINNGTCTAGTYTTPATSWSLQGNIGIEGQYVGTSNNLALTLKANNYPGLYINPQAGSVSIGSLANYPTYYKFEVNNGLSAFTGPNSANQNNLLVLYSGNKATAKYGQGFRHYSGFSHAQFTNGEEYGIFNTVEYSTVSGITTGKHLLIQSSAEGNLGIGPMSTAPAEKLTVNGNVQVGSSMPSFNTEGNKLVFGIPDENSDRIYMTRYNKANDVSTLRLHLGDDGSKDDVFEIGTRFYGTGQWTPAVRISASGSIVAKEICVNATLAWCDYVFEEDYKLMPLKELKSFINKHKHLPEIPSAKEIEKDGLNVNALLTLHMKKIEELSLHAISQEEKIEQLEERLSRLEKLLLDK